MKKNSFYKSLIIGTLMAMAVLALLFSYVAAAPTSNIFRTILPEADDTYNIGSASKKWQNLFVSDNAGVGSLTVSQSATSTGQLVVGDDQTKMALENKIFNGSGFFQNLTGNVYPTITPKATSSDMIVIDGKLTIYDYDQTNFDPIYINATTSYAFKAGLTNNIIFDGDWINPQANALGLMIGQQMSLSRTGNISGYAASSTDGSLAHHFFSSNNANYSGDVDNLRSITGGVYGGIDARQNMNAPGRTMSAWNVGFFSDVVFSGTEQAGTMNATNTGIAFIMETNQNQITNGKVFNSFFFADDLSFLVRPQDRTAFIYDSSQYPWILHSDNKFIGFGEGDGTPTSTDAQIYFNGTDLVVDPDTYGNGALNVAGDLLVDNNASTTGHLAALGGNSDQWNEAYGWGNHAMAGYLTVESDPVLSAWAGYTDSRFAVLNATTTNAGSLMVYDNATTTGALYVGDHLSIGTNESFHSLEVGGISMKLNTDHTNSDVWWYAGTPEGGQEYFGFDMYDNNPAQFNDLGHTFFTSADSFINGNLKVTNATTTGSLWVSDIATLATTTMAIGSRIGDSNFNYYNEVSKFTVATGYLAGSEFPVWNGYASLVLDGTPIGTSKSGFIVSNSIAVLEDTDQVSNPNLSFANYDLSATISIDYATTTNELWFLDAAGYFFDNNATTTGNFSVGSGASYAGQVVCYATDGQLGHCTSAVDSSGACTCAAN